MADYAYLVSELYNKLGKWTLVAEACGDCKERKGYYWQIAHGKIRKPNRTTKTAILKAAQRLMPELVPLTASYKNLQRGSIKIPMDLFKRVKLAKLRQQLTWAQFIERALTLMEGT